MGLNTMVSYFVVIDRQWLSFHNMGFVNTTYQSIKYGSCLAVVLVWSAVVHRSLCSSLTRDYWCAIIEVSLPYAASSGVGVTKPISSVPLFSKFFNIAKYMWIIECHANIWQLLSCGDTCQIWLWFKECQRYFYEIENFACVEIDEWNFSNPHPMSDALLLAEDSNG